MHRFLKFIFGVRLYMFRTVPLSIIRSFPLYAQQWYTSYRFADSLRARKLSANKIISTISLLHLFLSLSVRPSNYHVHIFIHLRFEMCVQCLKVR